MRPKPVEPPHWSPAELEQASRVAMAEFVSGWSEAKRYRDAFKALLPIVERLFESTEDLQDLRGEALLTEPEALESARYLTGPPLSQDDLQTLAGIRTTPPSGGTTAGDRVVQVLRACLDPFRFPWLVEDRVPTDQERRTAILWTTGLLAAEKARTGRRTGAARRQEEAVVAALTAAGWDQVSARELGAPDDLPRGCFARESIIAGAKCDIPVRLHDGRLLAVECKVSNSATNSVKRLNRETGGKAERWRVAFGRQVITVAVLSGVFKLRNLVDAQEREGVVIFWEHDLSPLCAFLEQAR